METYYSTQRPIGPGTYPKPEGNEVVEIHNFDGKTYCEELGREAWGYITYEQPLTPEQVSSYELTPEGVIWYPVTVSSRKHGGGLFVKSGMIVRSKVRPEDTHKETPKMQLKTRYFRTWEEAQRIMYALQSLDISTERVRGSATQGEVKVYINGEYILNFGDKIVLPGRGANPEDYYGDDIGGWRSSKPDSSFVLGLIWHPLDYVYHHSEKVCKALGITQEEWIEGNYWEESHGPQE
ncbi:MAG: hypothetical protein K2O18_09185 [Oscillospiraceae bacterium]|nr:hypothetical protein [Oscillospiraceae bacterium]